MEKPRYGILSTSSIAPRFIAAVHEADAGEIVAVSSRSAEKALQKAGEWNIPKAYGSHDALLNDPDVNTVYISTVNAQHYPWAKAALEHGKHVICEKPCTTSAEQTRELFALAREKNLFFMEAQKMLFLPTIIEVKRRIEVGELGEIREAKLSHSFSASYNTWMFDLEAGGGTLLSSGIYAVQLIEWFFGKITNIGGEFHIGPSGTEMEYTLSGKTESGVMFEMANSALITLDNTAHITGTKGRVDIPEYWKARKAVFHIDGKEPETIGFPCEHELVYEARHIAECLEKGLLTSPVVTEEVSVGGIEALELAKQS